MQWKIQNRINPVNITKLAKSVEKGRLKEYNSIRYDIGYKYKKEEFE